MARKASKLGVAEFVRDGSLALAWYFKDEADPYADAVAAAVVLAVIAGWLALGKFGSRGKSWRQVSLDLRGHEAFRRAGAPKTAPLELARGRLELTLALPTGSEPVYTRSKSWSSLASRSSARKALQRSGTTSRCLRLTWIWNGYTQASTWLASVRPAGAGRTIPWS